MTKASDNIFPKLIVAEGSAPSSPSAGDQKLFIDSADHKLKRKDSGGSVTTIEGGGSTSPLTTKGDVWGYSTVDARIPVGSNGQVLTADSTQTLGLKWAAAGGSTLGINDGPFWAPWSAPGSPDAKNAEFTGSQLGGMTRVYNSGASKGSWTEKYSAAHFALSTTGGNPELDVYAQSRTMSTGDYVEIAGAYPMLASFLGLFVGFADGVTFNNSGSHVVGGFIHVDTTGVVARGMLNTWDGFNTRTSDGTIYDTGIQKAVIQAWRVKYEAANTFGLYHSIDGLNWKAVQTNYAKTMTPSYVVFGASMVSGPASGGYIRIEYFRVNG